MSTKEMTDALTVDAQNALAQSVSDFIGAETNYDSIVAARRAFYEDFALAAHDAIEYDGLRCLDALRLVRNALDGNADAKYPIDDGLLQSLRNNAISAGGDASMAASMATILIEPFEKLAKECSEEVMKDALGFCAIEALG